MSAYFRFRTLLSAILFLALTHPLQAMADKEDGDKHHRSSEKLKDGLSIMVLGSGGPVANGKRVSAGYLVFTDRTPRLLIDVGGGVFHRIGQSGINIGGIEHILFSHMHMDHTGGLTPVLAMSFFHNAARGIVRTAPYRFIGPGTNAASPFPALDHYIDGHYAGDGGLERYLAGFPVALGSGSFRYKSLTVPPDTSLPMSVVLQDDDGLVVKAIAVHHGPVPALAYRVEYKGKSIVYSGDTTSKTDNMIDLSRDADLLIYDTAILDDTPPPFINLHTTPTRIGEVATESGARGLLLSHITGITEPALDRVRRVIRGQGFHGKLNVARDLQIINLGD